MSLLLGLGNIRYASLFPRDPKSFPAGPAGVKLRHWEDNALHLPKGRLLPIENLVANYGDATNTSWMDERFEVWRENDTGAAIAFVRVHSQARSRRSPGHRVWLEKLELLSGTAC